MLLTNKEKYGIIIGVYEMLTKTEKAIIQEFNSLKIPAIYKTDRISRNHASKVHS